MIKWHLNNMYLQMQFYRRCYKKNSNWGKLTTPWKHRKQISSSKKPQRGEAWVEYVHIAPPHTTIPTIITTINTSIITNDNNQMTGTAIIDISQYQ